MQGLKLLKTNDVLLRLYIYLSKNDGSFEPQSVAARLGVSRDRAMQALDLLVAKRLIDKSEPKILERSDEMPDYSAEDIKNSLNGDQKFKSLYDFTQNALNRMLSSAEIRALYGIYDWVGLPTEVIFLIITYCVKENKKKYGENRRVTMKSIDACARSWANLGIETTAQAEDYLKTLEQRGTRIAELTRLFHLTGRALSQTESRYISAWAEEDYSDELVLEAYDITVVKTGKLSWKYMDTILKSWKNRGYRDKNDVIRGERSKEDNPNVLTPEQVAALEKIKEINRRRGSE